ncbi:MAG: phenylalanine--tRNA ligase subunit beta [Nitrososphaerota archaeon]|nr:phenylalanine--tRNA ligase subunit beta [Candidatus Bathyarchaeota archaeon]MDW8048806.1 phenylalanine--tRNA ligase subunit beta [Nitrososphaerota archaeon]
MPTVEYIREDLESLIGTPLPREDGALNEILLYVKGEVKHVDDEEIHIEFKDSNRADLWGAEGLARALRGIMGLEKGLKKYEIKGNSGVDVFVDRRLSNIRPYIACSVVKNVKLTGAAIRQLMHFQDKLDQTYGRDRRKTSIGLYNFDLINPPLDYKVAEPEEIRFIPLDFDNELSLKEILELHPKGLKYAHLVRPHPVWPIFMDSKKKVLSFPPIINSNDLGRITEETVNVLVEVTGTSHKTVQDTLRNVTFALADRGGEIYTVKVHYPCENMGVEVTPRIETEKHKIEIRYVQKILGLDINLSQVIEYLEMFRYGVTEISESHISVEVPCYRVDVLHPIDIVEDIAIAHDYNKIQPRWPQLSTVGGLSEKTRLADITRELMIGLGFQEVLTYSLTSQEILFAKMNVEPEKVVEIANPKLTSMTCLRSWLLPCLMEFLSHNLHVEYPQRIFEVGPCVIPDPKEENKVREFNDLAAVIIHSEANFTEAKSILDAFLSNLGIAYEILECDHGSFIQGRTGRIMVGDEEAGIIGEIHPQVLWNWNLENPSAAFEINIDKLRKHLKTSGRGT